MQNYKKLFKNIEQKAVPENLQERILEHISVLSEKRNTAVQRVWSAISYTSIISCVGLAIYAIQDFSQSGFYQYFSLIFTDSAIITSHLNEFILSLVNSIPFFTITMITLSIFIFLISLKLRPSNHQMFRLKIS